LLMSLTTPGRSAPTADKTMSCVIYLEITLTQISRLKPLGHLSSLSCLFFPFPHPPNRAGLTRAVHGARPAGALRASKSAILPICRTRGTGLAYTCFPSKRLKLLGHLSLISCPLIYSSSKLAVYRCNPHSGLAAVWGMLPG